MPYSVIIKSSDGVPLQGTLDILDGSGNELGAYTVPREGLMLSDDTVDAGSLFKVAADGYGFIRVAQLYTEGNIFTLYKEFSRTEIAVVVFALGFIAGKFIRL